MKASLPAVFWSLPVVPGDLVPAALVVDQFPSGNGILEPGETVVVASYGTLAAGQVASCLATGDCYRLAVGVPAVRPELHWDATFGEATSTGSLKTWILHIGDTFTDVPRASPFYRFVETLLHHGVTGGCAPGLYCPGSAITREQPPPCVPGSEVSSWPRSASARTACARRSASPSPEAVRTSSGRPRPCLRSPRPSSSTATASPAPRPTPLPRGAMPS